jgi:hypothetical protein
MRVPGMQQPRQGESEIDACLTCAQKTVHKPQDERALEILSDIARYFAHELFSCQSFDGTSLCSRKLSASFAGISRNLAVTHLKNSAVTSCWKERVKRTEYNQHKIFYARALSCLDLPQLTTADVQQIFHFIYSAGPFKDSNEADSKCIDFLVRRRQDIFDVMESVDVQQRNTLLNSIVTELMFCDGNNDWENLESDELCDWSSLTFRKQLATDNTIVSFQLFTGEFFVCKGDSCVDPRKCVALPSQIEKTPIYKRFFTI